MISDPGKHPERSVNIMVSPEKRYQGILKEKRYNQAFPKEGME